MRYDDYDRLKREVERLERELERPITPERRRAVQDALSHNKQKLRALERRTDLTENPP